MGLLLSVDSFTYYMFLHWILAGGPPGRALRSFGGSIKRPRTSKGSQRDYSARSGIDAGSMSYESRSDSNRTQLGDSSAKGVDRNPKERA